MPRKSRIDAPGALHRIIARGFERNKIFQEDFERENFVERLVLIFQKLLKTDSIPTSSMMRRLLTGFCLGVRRGEIILSARKYSLTDLLKLHI